MTFATTCVKSCIIHVPLSIIVTQRRCQYIIAETVCTEQTKQCKDRTRRQRDLDVWLLLLFSRCSHLFAWRKNSCIGVHCVNKSRTIGSRVLNLEMTQNYEYIRYKLHRMATKKVQVGNDQEKAQSERNCHTKKSRWEKLNQQFDTNTKKPYRKLSEQLFPNRRLLSYPNLPILYANFTIYKSFTSFTLLSGPLLLLTNGDYFYSICAHSLFIVFDFQILHWIGNKDLRNREQHDTGNYINKLNQRTNIGRAATGNRTPDLLHSGQTC